MGILKLEDGHQEEAANYIKRCLEINKSYVPGLVAMGNLLYESGHSRNAAKYFK